MPFATFEHGFRTSELEIGCVSKACTIDPVQGENLVSKSRIWLMKMAHLCPLAVGIPKVSVLSRSPQSCLRNELCLLRYPISILSRRWSTPWWPKQRIPSSEIRLPGTYLCQVESIKQTINLSCQEFAMRTRRWRWFAVFLCFLICSISFASVFSWGLWAITWGVGKCVE